MKRMEQKQDLMQKMMGDPQVPAWYPEREKITLAMGDPLSICSDPPAAGSPSRPSGRCSARP